MGNYLLNVVVCTYNPNLDYIVCCLRSLKLASQKYSNFKIDFSIVDNNSTNGVLESPVVKDIIENLGATIYCELNQGLTHARLNGIKNTKGDYIVFIDDDNVVKEDYFEVGFDIIRKHDFIGAFSGSVEIVYDDPILAQRTMKYHGLLVKREIQRDLWSNIYFNNETMPCGAGLWIKRDVANHYLRIEEKRNQIISFDRIGKDDLSSGGDNDLAMTALDLGYGMGLFSKLEVFHLVPEHRTKLDYLLKLAAGIEYSSVLLKFIRIGLIPKLTLKFYIRTVVSYFLSRKQEREFQMAVFKGRKRAISKIKQISCDENFSDC